MTSYHEFISMVKEGFHQLTQSFVFTFKEAGQLDKFWWSAPSSPGTLVIQQPYVVFTIIQKARLYRIIYTGRSPNVLQIILVLDFQELRQTLQGAHQACFLFFRGTSFCFISQAPLRLVYPQDQVQAMGM